MNFLSRCIICCLLVFGLVFLNVFGKKYEPTWESLDSRPLPSWYDDGKIGIFIHWGVFSVPSYSSAWFWYNWKVRKMPGIVDFMQKNYRPGFTYADFAPQFTAEFYDPDQWADIFNASGASYIVLTTKHHEGFTNWPSNVSFNWNSMDVGPKRDLVGDLAKSIRKRTKLHFGLYHSLLEWFNPMYLKDKANNFTTQDFSTRKSLPELYEIVNRYQPEVIQSDGEWEASDTYWKSKEFLAWLYNDSPVRDTVAVNDAWGIGTVCKHGGYFTCGDKFNPRVLQSHKWQNQMTIDKFAWTYRRRARLEDFLTMDELTQILAETVSCGGNLLMNVGPTHDGRIVPIYEERLREMGAWLKVNGDAIYSTVPWSHQNDTTTPGVWYTSKKGASGLDVYAIVLDWPKDNTLTLGAPAPADTTVVTLLGYQGDKLPWKPLPSGGMTITIPSINYNKMPCQWAWSFKLEGLKNPHRISKSFNKTVKPKTKIIHV